jgi:hypothetical protein
LGPSSKSGRWSRIRTCCGKRAGLSWPTTARIRGRCKPTLATGTSNTPSSTRRYRQGPLSPMIPLSPRFPYLPLPTRRHQASGSRGQCAPYHRSTTAGRSRWSRRSGLRCLRLAVSDFSDSPFDCPGDLQSGCGARGALHNLVDPARRHDHPPAAELSCERRFRRSFRAELLVECPW